MIETKERILEKSFVLFLQRGYKEVSLNEIIRECEISKGAFYHHFESKEELYLDVLQRFFFSYFKKQDADYSTTSLETKFLNFAKTFVGPSLEISQLLKSKQMSAYFRFLFQAVNTFPEIQQKVSKHFYIKGYYLYQIVEQAKANGEVQSAFDSKTSARQVLASIVGVSVLEGISDIDEVEKRYHQILSAYYNLIKK